MEHFPPKRNLEDLWWSAFPVGTEWENIDMIKEFNWNFENLEKTLEEGGKLYGKTVYLFGSTEPQQLNVNGELKIVVVPVVLAVDCPFPPSDKIAINFVRTGKEEIVPMEEMKMSWVPYIPLQDRFGRIGSLKTKIFTLCCTQRRSVLNRMNTESANQFYYYTPYMPLNPPEDEDGMVVRVIYPLEPLVLAHKLVEDEGLPEDEREKIEEFLKEKVKQGKIELEQVHLTEIFNYFPRDLTLYSIQYSPKLVQAEEARKKAIEDMDPKQREAFENMKLYKFYPVKTPDTPDVNNMKSRHINRYYGRAHYLM
ncbi:hypothetical protein VPH35_008768 [Triticum aestivum]